MRSAGPQERPLVLPSTPSSWEHTKTPLLLLCVSVHGLTSYTASTGRRTALGVGPLPSALTQSLLFTAVNTRIPSLQACGFSCLSLHLLVDAMGVTYTCAALRCVSRDLDSVLQVCTVNAMPSAAPFSQRRTKAQS